MKSKYTGHHILKCSKCGIVIAQCRCMDKNKPIYFDICSECIKEGTDANSEIKPK